MDSQQLDTSASLLYGDRWQMALSRALGVDDRLVRRWAKGERPVPEWVEYWLTEALRAQKEKIEEMLAAKVEYCPSCSPSRPCIMHVGQPGIEPTPDR